MELSVEDLLVEARLKVLRGDPIKLLSFRMQTQDMFRLQVMQHQPDLESPSARFRFDNIVPMNVAMKIAYLTSHDPREYFLWSGDAWFTVTRSDGSRRSGSVVLVDRGDRVEFGFGMNTEGNYCFRWTAEVTEQGGLLLPATPDPARALFPSCPRSRTIRYFQGEESSVYFDRTEDIRWDELWPPRVLGELEDIAYDRIAETSECDDDLPCFVEPVLT